MICLVFLQQLQLDFRETNMFSCLFSYLSWKRSTASICLNVCCLPSALSVIQAATEQRGTESARGGRRGKTEACVCFASENDREAEHRRKPKSPDRKKLKIQPETTLNISLNSCGDPVSFADKHKPAERTVHRRKLLHCFSEILLFHFLTFLK